MSCARGFNAWATFADCCAQRTGAHLAGCTDLSAPTPTCFIPASFYPGEFSCFLELPVEAENSQPTNQSLTDNYSN